MKLCFACEHLFDGAGWCCPSCGYEPPRIGGYPVLGSSVLEDAHGFQSDFYTELSVLESRSFWFRARNRLIISIMRRCLPAPCRVLEIGCGTGFVLSALAEAIPDAELTGSEIFIAGLAYAAGRVPHAEFLQMDARELPFVKHFDLVGAFDVLEHIGEDERVLAQIHRALRPSGGLILSVPQHPWLWSRQDEFACHVRRYAAGELRQKVVSAGFRVLYETSFVSLLLPFMVLSRLRKNQALTDNDAMSELRIGPIGNAVFGGAMSIERRLICAGIRFPVGGSRLLVAQRVAR